MAFQERLQREDKSLQDQFSDLFPDDIPHIAELPTDVYHRFHLKDPNMVMARRQYECLKKYREVWKQLLDGHLQAGRLRPTSSPYASPAFLVPKTDPTALPRWVNDYRALNSNTVPDVHPLPSISEILSDCGKGKSWGKMDMTNSFFQTFVHLDDIPYTTVTTPYGLYEWTVMPQGCRNAPATHQRRMFNALRPFIGSIFHVYLDDIIIWSDTIEQHRDNVRLVLDTLRRHKLCCSPKKTKLFCTDLNFLGHHISQCGIEADGLKVDKVLSWPEPRSVKEVRSFLGLVRYIANFLPALADHTRILNTLTTKEAEKNFLWTGKHSDAFDAIKKLVTSRECLTVIDHNNMGDNRIWVSCDASDWCTGAVLSYGPTVETARPVAFESQVLKGAELNYPVHEKELLSVVRSLKKWLVDLIGVPFTVLTDHRTLENFSEQKHLLRRQARWQEYLAQYDFEMKYVAGKDNEPADTMSRIPDLVSPEIVGTVWIATQALCSGFGLAPHAARVASVNRLHVATDPDRLATISDGYALDKWSVWLAESLWDSVAQSKFEGGEGVLALEALRRGWLDGRERHGIVARNGDLRGRPALCS